MTDIRKKHRDERAEISARVGLVCGPVVLVPLLSLCAWLGVLEVPDLVLYGLILLTQLLAVLCWLWSLIQWPQRFRGSFWLLSFWCLLLVYLALYGLP